MENSEVAKGRGRRFFYWWADRPVLQAFVLLLATSLAIIGYLKPALIRDVMFPPEPAAADGVESDEPSPLDRRNHDLRTKLRILA